MVLMKKLSLYVFLVLMWSNISMANEKAFGEEGVELIYSCNAKNFNQKNVIFGFNYINKLGSSFEENWTMHHYDYQNKRFRAAINHVMIASLNAPQWLLSWSDIKEDGHYTYLLKFKGEPNKYMKILKSNINRNVEIESFFLSSEYFDENMKILKSEVFSLRKQLFNEKNFDKFNEIFELHDEKMRILLSKSIKDEFVAINYKCKRLNK